MEDIVESLFISTLDNERASCNVQDLRTGTDLMRYKGGGAMHPHSLQMLGGHFVIAANSTKPLLHVWPINGQEPMSNIRYVVPGKVNALALTPDGSFLVAGIQENIYVWHLNSGRLLNTLSRHFQAITCIRFTDNGEHFASAGKDGAVLVWNLTRATAPLGTGDSEENAPFYSFNDHGLAVTDVHIGHGGIKAFLYSVSLDRCCKVYDLSSGNMLLSVVFPVALHSVIVNRLETDVYVGTAEGQVLVFHMDRVPRMKEYHLEEQDTQGFIKHTKGTAVTCLALSANADQLISGGEDKLVCIWDISSRQLIKSLPQVGALSNLHLRLINSALFHPGPKQPKFFADNLKRMISPPDNNDCIELLITEEYTKNRPAKKWDIDTYYNLYDTVTAAQEVAANNDDDDVENEDMEDAAAATVSDEEMTPLDNEESEEEAIVVPAKKQRQKPKKKPVAVEKIVAPAAAVSDEEMAPLDKEESADEIILPLSKKQRQRRKKKAVAAAKIASKPETNNKSTQKAAATAKIASKPETNNKSTSKAQKARQR